VTVSTRVMARAVVVATLSRSLPASDAVDLLARLNVGADPQTVIDEHSQCYPATSQSRVLEPLYPDRLGEDFVAAVLPGAPPGPPDGLPLEFLADPAATATVDLLLSDSNASTRKSALTILVETARRWDHVAATLLNRLWEAPELLISCGGSVIARAATIPALAPMLPQIGALLDEAIGTGSHLTLAPGAVVVQQQLVIQARSGDDRARLADSLRNLAICLASAGRRPEALDAAQEAADLCYELVGLNRDAHLPNLARSVNNLGNRLAAVGRRAEALDTSQEAVTLHRELAKLNPDAHLPGLAMSVSSLGLALAEAGRHAEALDTSQEAVTLYRELVRLNPDAHLPELAMSMNNFGIRLAEVGRRAEALDTGQEAVTLRRELVRLDPDAHLPDLARSVHNLSIHLAAVGRRAEALDTAQEAAN